MASSMKLEGSASYGSTGAMGSLRKRRRAKRWCEAKFRLRVLVWLRGGKRNKHKLPVSTKSWRSGRKPKCGRIRACGKEGRPAGLWTVVSVGPWLGQLWKAGNWFQQLPAALRTAAQTSGALWQIEADCWWRSIDFPFLNRGIISQEKHLLITHSKEKKKGGGRKKIFQYGSCNNCRFFFFPSAFSIKFIVLEGRHWVGRVCLRSLLQ